LQELKAAWTVSSDPSGKNLVDKINIALATYQDMGLTKQGSAMLVGNFISESGLDPLNCLGDGGTACGLGQWRFSRQEGMPQIYEEQLKWAVEVEMVRDSGGHQLKASLFDPNASIEVIYEGLRQWERWGVAGDRYNIGQAILAQI
jgi:hypothetical protein